MSHYILETKKLYAGYDSLMILKDINLEISPGKLIGIIGPNGSGKSTLIKAFSGVLNNQKGNILFNGENIKKIQLKDLAKKIAVVCQDIEVNYMNVFDYVLLGRIPYFKSFQFFETQSDREIAEKYLKLTDSYNLKNKTMDKISGGERQLITIARALAQEPKLLLLDEPTAHLDITHQSAILDLLKTLIKELKLSIVIVLHDLNLASQYSDFLVLLNNGKIYSKGSPSFVITYQAIEEVYKTVVLVKESPLTGKPHIFFVPGEIKNK